MGSGAVQTGCTKADPMSGVNTRTTLSKGAPDTAVSKIIAALQGDTGQGAAVAVKLMGGDVKFTSACASLRAPKIMKKNVTNEKRLMSNMTASNCSKPQPTRCIVSQ